MSDGGESSFVTGSQIYDSTEAHSELLSSVDVLTGDSEDAGSSKGRPKKRPREAKPIKTVASVLDAVVAPPPDFDTLKNLLRKTNRSYQEAFGEGFAAALENATEVHQLLEYYHTYCNAKAAEIMGKCLLFYKQAHNFVYTASDEKIIARAAARPVVRSKSMSRKPSERRSAFNMNSKGSSARAQ